jgi:alpha-glucuronidase
MNSMRSKATSVFGVVGLLWILAGPLVGGDAGDWYDLWLRYRPIANTELQQEYRNHATEVVVQGSTPISGSIRDELQQGLSGMLAQEIPFAESVTRCGAVVAGCPETSPIIAGLGWGDELALLGQEGFLIRSTEVNGHPVTVIAGGGERGALYGTFRYLRHLQLHGNVRELAIQDQPRNKLRQLNHWDNWRPTRHFGTIERGYAGGTLWKWRELPDTVDPRYRDYARANASIGINGTVINSVNAQIDFIQTENLPKVAALADVFRAYGIQLFLSVRYDSPVALGRLPKSDPLGPAVQAWWQEKVAEIYKHIPDFGGFLVKGDSEGQPGPLQYGRNHAVGANMLADALRPHGGIVMWRTFVYGPAVRRFVSNDRVKQGFEVFKPLDGQFADNVILQAKNGPLDFQVREPVNPLFGQMPNTQTGIELQLTQEYTGTHTALCWLIPQWREIFDFDTMAKGAGSTVKRVIDGSLHDHGLSLVAGVANTGSDRNWTGHPLAQANWYGFGRLAWDPTLEPEQIADEWTRMTFPQEDAVVTGITAMLLGSWRTYEQFTHPIGLNLMVERGTRRLHPEPAARQVFHRATRTGVGFDRTRGGSGYVDQYHLPVADMYNELATCPEELLLWFHHVPYTHELKSGQTVIQHLYVSYREGVRGVESMITTWESLEDRMDAQRYADVREKLQDHLQLAERWRDTLIAYFQELSGIPEE